MSPADLRQEIAIEWEAIQLAVDELSALKMDLTGREPTEVLPVRVIEARKVLSHG